MSTSPSPGASPVPTSPPSTNATSPPPPTTNTTSPPPPTTNTTSPPPPSATPTAPPPATPSAPPPATPSPPPPATTTPTPPSTSLPPPTSGSNSPPPPTSGTNSPPPPVTRSSPPPPPSGSSTPSTPTPSPPPPPSSPSSSTTVPTGAIVGIAAGAVAILVILILVCVCRRRKKRRTSNAEYYVPPQGPKGDQYGGPPRQWQHNAPPPSDNVVSVMQKPPPQLPAYAAKPPPPPLFLSSSGGSGSNYSGGENPHRPPSPGIQLGFSKSTFTYEELVRATDGFSDANLLGQGGFGYVHKGILPNGKEVAIKQLKAGSGQGEREFQAEVEIISRVHHRHLVSLVGYCITGHQRLLVYEFVLNNTLEFHLHGKGRPTMDWPTRLKIALGSAKGLAYLHEDCHPKIIHRDIKAANILLDFKFEAKVADFGLAKFSPDVNTHVSTRVMGTFGYLAPEYASSGKLSDKSDVFSFGVMLLELITGRRPVDTTHTFMDDSLVEWARPLLIRALEEHDFDSVVDPRLKDEYDVNEMTRMVACGAACTRHSARHRPKMSQVVRALEGDMSLSDLNEGIKPGHSSAYSFRGSSDYDTAQYKEDMKKFRKMTLGTQELGVSNDYSAPTSDNSLYPSGSSSEGQSRQTTREMELRKMKNHQVYSGSS